MKKIIWIITSMLIVILVGCSTYNKVHSTYDRSVEFSKYKTFAWLHDKTDTSNSSYNNKIIRNNIRNYFGLCMSDRAYIFDRKNPDLLMQLIIKNSDKKLDIGPYPSYNYGPSFLGSDYYSPYDNDYYYNVDDFIYDNDNLSGQEYLTDQKAAYINRSITLNLIDRKTKKLVWSGTAIGDIYVPLEINYDLHPAIHKILNAYPVKPVVRRKHKIR